MSNDVKGGWTPGPWVWHSREGFASNYEWECETLRDGANHVLISLEDIYPGYAECGEHLVMKVDPKVARLIAAAPELFEALVEAVTSGVYVGHTNNCAAIGGHGYSIDDGRCDCYRKRAMAAIAKATGGAPTP